MWHQLDLLLDRPTQENEREFYGLIGLVAVRFARLEANLTDLLGALIHPNDDLLTATLTEDIVLFRTIELIKKIGPMRSVNGNQLHELVSAANALRQDRNDYVHGVWDIQIRENGEIAAQCSRREIAFKQTGSTKLWTRGYKSKTVTLNQLQRTALELEDLSKKIKKLLEEIEENPDRILE
jgi:hypothetical protein